MAKKQTSFADKAAKLGKEAEAVYVKYVKSVKSEKTGQYRFNEQMVRTSKSESIDAALKRISDSENLRDIDLSEFVNQSNQENVSESDLTQAEALPDDSLKSESHKETTTDEKTENALVIIRHRRHNRAGQIDHHGI